eukprot:3917609-Amphidinium_carterae.2
MSRSPFWPDSWVWKFNNNNNNMYLLLAQRTRGMAQLLVKHVSNQHGIEVLRQIYREYRLRGAVPSHRLLASAPLKCRTEHESLRQLLMDSSISDKRRMYLPMPSTSSSDPVPMDVGATRHGRLVC